MRHCRFRCSCRNCCYCRPSRDCKYTAGRRCWRKCYTSVASCVALSFLLISLPFSNLYGSMSTLHSILGPKIFSASFSSHRARFRLLSIKHLSIFGEIYLICGSKAAPWPSKHCWRLRFFWCFRSIAESMWFQLSWIDIILIRISAPTFLSANKVIRRYLMNWEEKDNLILTKF